MTYRGSTVDCAVLWGTRAGIGLGYTMETAAVRLAEDIAELREDGGIPAHVRTVISVLPQQRVLDIQIEGLSVDADPARATIREVLHALFELASAHNIVSLDASTPPTFTQRIRLVDADGRPFCALVGAGMGDVDSG